jgi:4-aminobutyrate aminotransferase-like enzyme
MTRALTKAETLKLRQQVLGRNLSIAYQNPVKIVRGSMQYLYDDEGHEYLDAYNNVAHVGHCHPRVVKAGQEQMATLNSNTRYLSDLVNTYAQHCQRRWMFVFSLTQEVKRTSWHCASLVPTQMRVSFWCSTMLIMEIQQR